MKTIACFVFAALFGLLTVAHADSFAGLSLEYHVDFTQGTLNPVLDLPGIGPMKLGSTNTSGSNPSWTFENGGLTLGLTQPATGDLVSAGVFATGVDFGPGSILGLRATFVAPTGPHADGTIWAVAVGARTGGGDDLATEVRGAATLQSRGSTARMNAVDISVPPPPVPLAPDVFNSIYSPTGPTPFTLDLIVDRVSGTGYESLYVGDDVIFSRNFTFADFRADGGPSITAVGPSIAIASAPGQSASVRLLDFQVYSTPDSAEGILPIAGLFLFCARRWRGKTPQTPEELKGVC